MTQYDQARSGQITDEMRAVSQAEGIDSERLRHLIAEGKVIIPRNRNHEKSSCVGIGTSLRTKVNANIGTSQDRCNLNEELEKLRVAIEAGTDTVMDLSTGGEINTIRKIILEHSTVPVGSVPIYQMVVELLRTGKNIDDLTEQIILDTIEKHAADVARRAVTDHAGTAVLVVGHSNTVPAILKSLQKFFRHTSNGPSLFIDKPTFLFKSLPLLICIC